MTGQLSLWPTFAPNTPGHLIERGAPYHCVALGTVSDCSHQPNKCRSCRQIANPAHVTDQNDSLAVWCAAHCPTCRKWDGR